MLDSLNLMHMRQYAETIRRQQKQFAKIQWALYFIGFALLFVAAIVIGVAEEMELLTLTENQYWILVFTAAIFLDWLWFINAVTIEHNWRDMAQSHIQQTMTDLPFMQRHLLSGRSRVAAGLTLVAFQGVTNVALVGLCWWQGVDIGVFMVAAWFVMIYFAWAEFWLEGNILSFVRPKTYPPDMLGLRRRHSLRVWMLEWGVLLILPALIYRFGLHTISPPLQAIAAILYYFGVLKIVPQLLFRWIWGPAHTGQYDISLDHCRFLGRFFPTSGFLEHIQGIMLLAANRHREAEPHFCQVLAHNPSRQYQIMGVTGLLEIRQETDRMNEAIRLAEVAAMINPADLLAYLELADIYLRSYPEPARALAMVDMALEQLRKSHRYKQLRRMERNVHMRRAWALTSLGRYEEADFALQQATEVPAGKLQLSRAYELYMMGQIKRLRGELVTAHQYFQQSNAADPDGHIGKLAAEALEDMEPRNG